AGAAFIGLNPLHALFPDRPGEASPYRPSSRAWLNVLYLDLEAIPEFQECLAAHERVEDPAFRARLGSLRAAELVDYPGAAAAKLGLLELLFDHFRERHLAAATVRGCEFRAFQAAGGDPLRLHALFEALQEHFARGSPAVWGWPAWPDGYRD